MAKRESFVHKKFNRQEIQDASYEKLATDPLIADLYEGRFWYNTTDQRLKHYISNAICTVACMSDLANIGQFQGVHNATSGIPAGANVNAGDFWRVSVAGTIAGITGEPDLEVNDMIYALQDNPTLPAHFSAVQANANHEGYNLFEEQTINLVAGTPLIVTPATFAGRVSNAETFLPTEEEKIDLEIKKNVGGNNAKITSNVALSNVLVSLYGAK